MSTKSNRPASGKQIDLIQRLASEKEIPAEILANWPVLQAAIAGITVTMAEASAIITWLFTLNRKAVVVAEGEEPPAPVTPGVYQVGAEIFIVKPTRDKQRLYAKKLVEIGGERLTETGNHVQIDFEYAPGAMQRIRAEHKMPLEQARELTIRYGRCIVCGRWLTDATSVERGIGPVCIKAFAA